MILLIPLVTVIVNYHNEFHQENINNNGGLLNAGNENANISLNSNEMEFVSIDSIEVNNEIQSENNNNNTVNLTDENDSLYGNSSNKKINNVNSKFN